MPAAARRLYHNAIRRASVASRQSIDQAGRTVLSDGEYAAAATSTSLRRIALRPARTNATLHAGRQALQAGHMPRGVGCSRPARRTACGRREILRFMIMLARASNDTKRAQMYARRLMRMSEGVVAPRWLMAFADALVPSAQLRW